MVEQAAGCFSGVDIQLTFDGRLGEDVGGVPLIQYIIGDMLDNCSCLFVVNQGGSTNDKLFGIVFELIKSDLFNASQNSNYGFSGQTCFFHELSDKIIFHTAAGMDSFAAVIGCRLFFHESISACEFFF